MSTEIIVLAAGRGSRLGERTDAAPKWLLDIAGQPIAERQLAAIQGAVDESAGSIASVRVVTGHAADAIESFLADRDGVDTVYNPQFAELNNWYSVLVALRTRAAAIDRVGIINADLFAPASWLKQFFVDAARTSSDSLIGIDLARALTDESMKVSARPGAQGDAIEAIGKVEVAAPVGEYVGLLMAGGDVLDAFERTLEAFVGDDAHADAWYERTVGLTAAEGMDWRIWPTPGTDWVEIDDHDDHAAAVALEGGR